MSCNVTRSPKELEMFVLPRVKNAQKVCGIRPVESQYFVPREHIITHVLYIQPFTKIMALTTNFTGK